MSKKKRTRKPYEPDPLNMLTPTTAARALKRNPNYVCDLIAKGKLPARREGDRIYIYRAHLEEWMKQSVTPEENGLNQLV